MSKLCVLGEDVEPCFEGASISKVQFSFEDNFKQRLFSLIEAMKEILSNDEGGTPVFNTYAVEIGGRLWDAIYDYMWNNHKTNDELIYRLVGVYEETEGQKFAVLQNREDSTYSRLNFSLTDTEEFIPADELIQFSFDSSDNSQFTLEDINSFETEYKQKKNEEEEKKSKEE
jgi:hypothetical protein